MRTRERIVASSHRDRADERIPPEELEKLSMRHSGLLVPIHIGHDYSRPPVGRVVGTDTRPTEDGELALVATLEFWDPDDSAESLQRKGRIPGFEPKAQRFEVQYGEAFLTPHRMQYVNQLAELGGQEDKPRYFSQKALDPSSILLISTVFAATNIAVGFFSKLGEDIYEKLKSMLMQRTEEGDLQDGQIVFRFMTQPDGSSLQVLVLIDEPSPTEIGRLFDGGFEEINTVIESALEKQSEAKRVVVAWRDDKAEFLYSMREDGVPNPREIISDEELASGEWSIGGSSTLVSDDVTDGD